MSTLSSPTSAVEHSARDANMARMAKSLQRQNDWTLRLYGSRSKKNRDLIEAMKKAAES